MIESNILKITSNDYPELKRVIIVLNFKSNLILTFFYNIKFLILQ